MSIQPPDALLGALEELDMDTLDVVGRSVPRDDARDKVRGAAIYLEDMKLQGMLYGKILRSRCSHARVLRVDVSRAEALPGVRGVVTGLELPYLHGESLVDEPFLARDKVRYVGEAVAAVAAVDEETAEEAIGLIRVEYEELSPLVDVLEATRPGAPLVHEALADYSHAPGIAPIAGTNICNHFQLRRGDVERGFADADRIFDDTFTTPMQQHCALEPHGAICLFTSDDRVTLWTNNDSPYRCRKELAAAFGIPLADVRVISAPNIGGNFGGKGGLKAESVAAALAWKVRNIPIRIVYTREEEFAAAIGRHPSVIRMKTGVRNDGTILAREVTIHLDAGAYAEKGPTVVRFCGLSAAGPYTIPHVKVDGYCVYTNKTVAGAMRGYGGPQAAWAYESQMDIIAHALGIDPLEIRRRQVYRDGDEHITGQPLESESLTECLDELAAAMGWGARPLGKDRGRGIACMERAVKTPFGSAAFIKVNEDATVDILSSSTDVGQGSATVLRQIVAEELGVPLANVRKAPGDTAFTPFDASTTSSRTTFHMGNAVRIAAADVKAQIVGLAAPMLEAPATEIRIKNGEVFAERRPDVRLSIAQVLGRQYGPCGVILGRGYYWPSPSFRPSPQAGGQDREKGTAEYYSRFMAFWLLGACGAEVEVDRSTGRVTVLRLWGAYDAGKAINPMGCEGQIQGGTAIGLGFALSEDLVFEDGSAMNPSFLGYKVPTAADVPTIVPLIVEHPHPDGPFGAKGLGETTNVAVAPAIANAIFDAVGVRIRTLPLTPDKILEALKRLDPAKGADLRHEDGTPSPRRGDGS